MSCRREEHSHHVRSALGAQSPCPVDATSAVSLSGRRKEHREPVGSALGATGRRYR